MKRKSGKQIKYGYIFSSHTTPNNLLISFYKAKTMIEMLRYLIKDLPKESDYKIVNVLRVELPENIDCSQGKDNFEYTRYIVKPDYNFRIRDLKPVIVHNDYEGRGFRVDSKLTRLYNSNPDNDDLIKKIFLDKVPAKYFKDLNRAKYN